MRSSKWESEFQFVSACQAGLRVRRALQAGKTPHGRKIHRGMLLVLVVAIMVDGR